MLHTRIMLPNGYNIRCEAISERVETHKRGGWEFGDGDCLGWRGGLGGGGGCVKVFVGSVAVVAFPKFQKIKIGRGSARF